MAEKQWAIYHANTPDYYSTYTRDAHIWSARARYLSSVHNGYPTVYVGRQVSSEILQCSA